jgi:glyoxylase-like metal-dependent hydrolase (beta-lactamase superfamily II)
MKIDVFYLGPLETCSYLVSNDNQAVAIDVGGDPSAMVRAIQQKNLTLTHILLSHLHFDHILGVPDLLAACKKQAQLPQVLLHEADAWMLRDDGSMGMPQAAPFPYSQVPLGKQTFANMECQVLATPGHTPGGVSYYFPALKAVFSGDALFYRSVGRTDFPGGDADTLFKSIRSQLFTLPDDTTVYPGHDRETTIGAEKRGNPFVSGATL